MDPPSVRGLCLSGQWTFSLAFGGFLLPKAPVSLQFAVADGGRPWRRWGFQAPTTVGETMTTDQDVRPRAPRQVGRRAVTRGAAWSIPVVSLAVAAPAMAASGCTPVTGVLSWDQFASGTKQTGNVLATAG